MGIQLKSLRMLAVAFALASACFAGAGSDIQLVDAVEQGNTEAVRSLLKDHADVNKGQADGATPLHWAIHRDDLETADLLIRAGANVNAANDYGVTPLSLACTNGNSPAVEKLLKAGAKPNLAQWTGETPLMTCSRAGALAGVKALIARGAEVNARTKRGQTALMWATAEKHSDVVRELIDRKADIHARSNIEQRPYEPMISEWYTKDIHFPSTRGGFTPLMFAAQVGDLESAKILVAAGADVNESTTEDGNTLVVASANGHEEVALFLLGKGADPKSADGYGITALHWSLQEGIQALSGGGPRPTDRFWLHSNMPELMKALVQHGADPNAPIAKDFAPYDNHRYSRGLGNNLPQMSLAGSTPFLLAAGTGNTNAMRLLMEAHATTQTTTVQGVTPLMVVSGVAREREARTPEELKAYLEAAKMLVQLGADVNAVDQQGRTAMHGAVYMGDPEMVQFLAGAGANVNAKDKYGQSPMTIALGDPEGLVYRQLSGDRFDYSFRQPREQKKVADLLLKLGATPFTGKYRDRSAE